MQARAIAQAGEMRKRFRPLSRSLSLPLALTFVLSALSPSALIAEELRRLAGDTPIVQVGAEQLTLDELRTYLVQQQRFYLWRRGRLPPREALQEARVRRELAIAAIERRLLLREAHHRQLWPERGEVETSISVREGVDWRARLSARLAPLGGLSDEFWHLAHEEAALERLRIALTEAIPMREFYDEWSREQRQVHYTLVKVSRVPTSREISAAIAGESEALQAWYTAHPRLFSQPARGLMRALIVPAVSEEARATRRPFAEALRARANAGEPLLSLAPLVGPVGITQALRQRVIKRPARLFSPAQRPLEAGAASLLQRHQQGWRFFVLDKLIPPQVRPLENESVRREVASALLREEDRLPHARSLADEAKRRLESREDLVTFQSWAKVQRIRVSDEGPLSLARDGFVPGVGRAPDLFQSLFSAAEGDCVGPLSIRQVYAVAMVTRSTEGTEAKWAQTRDRWLPQAQRRALKRVSERWLLERYPVKESARRIAGEQLQSLSLDALLPPLPVQK